MGEGFHDDQGDEGNPIGKGPNKGVVSGSSPRDIFFAENDRYDCDQGEERNPMG
jgi:hypothetical protein